VAKVTVQFTCAECGTTSGRWLGKCPGCGAFGSLVEELHGSPTERGAVAAMKPVPLGEVRSEEAARISTGVAELDRVLGGGIVPGSLVLVGGEPGVGKSTLLLTALGAIARSGQRALLVTGEESAAQVSLRAARLGGMESVAILAETELDAVCATLEAEKPDVCVIDSVQTLHAAALGSAPGSVAQVREAAGRLLRVAKEAGVATVLVGHVTKDGAVAGPRVLEHLVDCVLQFEGDRYHEHRVLRATKNRFGSTNELGVFEMTAAGLVGVPDPSELFGTTHAGEVGAAVGCALEGTRPILLEIQALVAPTDLAMPRRVATGVDPKRLAMIVAVLGRHAGLALASSDVFVNVAGGVRIEEPGADLAVALAIASAARGVPVREGAAAFGEIGLTGRLRHASQAERRLEECAKFGVATVLVPEGTQPGHQPGETVDRLNRLAGLHPDRAVVQLNLGVALFWSGSAGAEDAWRAAAADEPDSPYAIAAGNLLHPEYAPGVPVFVATAPLPKGFGKLTPPEQLRALARDARHSVPARLLYGSALQRLGRPRSAERVFAAAARLAPRDVEAQVADAVGRFDKARPADAFSRLGPLTRSFPNKATVRFHLGVLLLWSGETAEAKRQLTRAVHVEPGSPLAGEAQRYLAELRKAGV